MKQSAGLILLMSILVSGCEKDNQGEDPNCMTSNVSYSSTITGIINTYNCLSCHGATPSAPFSLHTYAGVKARVDDGRLFGAINHQAGFSPMPQGGAKMSQCDINKVKAWIDAGAQNN